VILCVDVDYRANNVVAACVGFDAWTDATAALELVVASDAAAAAYEPGQFYLRELPHVLGVLALAPAPDVIVVDGYVWLAPERPGLGARLHDAVGVPVVGVAKNPFVGAQAIEVARGVSARPLYVTAVGLDAQVAADHVRDMHGEFRIPTLLRRVDQLARE
jgi:deoxyribonuclease V